MDMMNTFSYFQSSEQLSGNVSLMIVYDDKPSVVLNYISEEQDKSKPLMDPSKQKLFDGVKMILIRPTV